MKFAFSTISCPDYTIAQVKAAREQYGYDAVELYALDGMQLRAETVYERRHEIRTGLGGTPIICVNSAVALASESAEQRASVEASVVLAMRAASDLESPLAKVFGGDLAADAPASGYDEIAGSIQRILDQTAGLGVTLVMETHDGFCRGERLAELLRRVDDPAFAALWDVHHPYRMGEDVATTDREIGDRVRHVHVKDARRVDDAWDYTELGQGELPVVQILEALQLRGYDGYLSLDWEKMWHPEIAGPEIVLPQYRAKLGEYVAALGAV